MNNEHYISFRFNGAVVCCRSAGRLSTWKYFCRSKKKKTREERREWDENVKIYYIFCVSVFGWCLFFSSFFGCLLDDRTACVYTMRITWAWHERQIKHIYIYKWQLNFAMVNKRSAVVNCDSWSWYTSTGNTFSPINFISDNFFFCSHRLRRLRHRLHRFVFICDTFFYW